MTKLSKELKELVEGVISAKSDKKVIDAFLDGGAMIGEKLETDGEILNGKWSGGNGIAKWEGKKIVFADLGSKASSDVEKAVRKAAPKDLIEEVIDDEQEDVVEAFSLKSGNSSVKGMENILRNEVMSFTSSRGMMYLIIDVQLSGMKEFRINGNIPRVADWLNEKSSMGIDKMKVIAVTHDRNFSRKFGEEV